MRQRADHYVVDARPGAVRFRYRLAFQNQVALSSTGAGLDATHLYAVSRSVFVAPDPADRRLAGRSRPVVLVHIGVPAGWRVVTSWGMGDRVFTPPGVRDLWGGTIAAAPDYRVYHDTAAGVAVVLAIRGQRLFADSALERVIDASLREASSALGPVPVSRVTYTADLGWKGLTSGSLQGRSAVGLLWAAGETLGRARIHDVFHETLHLWLGGAALAPRWWMEGVNDYLAARLEAEWTGRPADLAGLCFQSLQQYLRIRRNTTMTMDEEQRENVLGDNTTLLIYRKGMLAGLLLDATIRRRTGGEASLDDVARRALAVAAERPSRRVTGAELRELAVAAGGDAVARLWRRVVDGETLISEEEVAAALRTVTGLDTSSTAVNAKEQEAVPGHPKP